MIRIMDTKIFEITSPDCEKINEVADILKNGGIVAIPTETVYGLAGNALSAESAEKIFKAKGRPSDNPFIVHISELSEWDDLVESIPEPAKELAEKFWPGPLTIILPKSDKIPLTVSGGLSTVGVRMPSHEIARAIIKKAGIPLAAPSANTSGKPSPTCADHVKEDLMGRIDAIVDGGESDVGVESTVISLAVSPPRLFRPGGITPEMLTEVLGEFVVDDAVYEKLADGTEAPSPGMKYKHYSPKAKVTIIKGSFDAFKKYAEENKDDGTYCLLFEGEEKEIDLPSIVYGKKNDPSSQAKHIFDSLRKLDKADAKTVFARFPESDGVGLAVFNRLIRASGFNMIEVE